MEKGRVCELALLAWSSPPHKASLLPGHPHSHPTQAWAQGLIFPSSCQSWLEGPGEHGAVQQANLQGLRN
jgi:hypothetical protein